jgi:hypothetical protein
LFVCVKVLIHTQIVAKGHVAGFTKARMRQALARVNGTMLPPARPTGPRADYIGAFKIFMNCAGCPAVGVHVFQLDHAACGSKKPPTNGCNGAAGGIICRGAGLLLAVMELLITQVLCGNCHFAKNDIEQRLRLMGYL